MRSQSLKHVLHALGSEGFAVGGIDGLHTGKEIAFYESNFQGKNPYRNLTQKGSPAPLYSKAKRLSRERQAQNDLHFR